MTFYETHFTRNIGIIDLSDLSVQVVPLDESIISEHIGGAAVNRILFDRYGDDNPIILGTGPLTGSFAPASCLMIATFRSPLSGRISNVPLTIRTGPEMKCAGFDFIIIKNAALQTQVISVRERTMTFHTADSLLNRGITEASTIMRREIGHARSAIITGPAAEKNPGCSSVSLGRGGSFDKTGLASIMASKNLKGIVFDGIDGLPFGDGNLVRSETMLKELASSLRGKRPGINRVLEQIGADSAIIELLSAKKMRPMACYHCPFPCMSHIDVVAAPVSERNDVEEKRKLTLTDHLGFVALADKCKADVFPVIAACTEGGLDPVAVSRLIPGGGILPDILSMVQRMCDGTKRGEPDKDNHMGELVPGGIPQEERDRFGGGMVPLTSGEFASLESWKKRVALSMILGICPLFLLMFPEINDSDLIDFLALDDDERGPLQDRLHQAIDSVCRF